MKKQKSIFAWFALTMLFAATIATSLFAQVDTTATGIDPATGTVTENSIGALFATIGTLGALVLMITAFIRKQGVRGYNLHWLSWVVALLCAVVGKIIGIGMFANLNWALSLFAGFFAGTAANGVADWQVLQSIFAMIKKR